MVSGNVPIGDIVKTLHKRDRIGAEQIKKAGDAVGNPHRAFFVVVIKHLAAMRAGGCQIKTFRCLPEAGKDDCAIPPGRDAVHRITVFAVFVIRQQPFIERRLFFCHVGKRQEEKAFVAISTVGEKLQTVAFPIERGQDRIAALQGVFQRGNSDCGRRRKSDVAKWDDVAACFCTVDKMRIGFSQQGV